MLTAIKNRVDQVLYSRVLGRIVNIPESVTLVTFTFDDFPESAIEIGGRLLEKYDARGTYYLAPGLCGTDTVVGKIVSETDAKKIIDAGHELGHHTFSHVDCNSETLDYIAKDIARADKFFGQDTGMNFSFPFGESNTQVRLNLKDKFRTCRGIHSGINRGNTDILELKSNAVYSCNEDLANLEQLLSEVSREGGWLIFYTHDVTERPSSCGCTEDELEHLISTAASLRLPIVTMREAIDRLDARK